MSKSDVTVSVVMPVHNAEAFLRDCLDSVVGQTLTDIEIICVDDGSTDSSLSILDEYAAKDTRIKVISQQNLGAAVARNKGIDIAEGEYLSILDSDDIFELRMLEKMAARAKRTSAEIVMCRCEGFEDSTGSLVPMAWSINNDYLPKNKVFSRTDVGDALFTFAQGWAWDKLYLTSFVREQNLRFQNLRSSNDLLFTFLSLAIARRITVENSVLVHQRRNRTQSISLTRYRNADCFYFALRGLRDELYGRGLLDELEAAFANLCVHLSMWHFNTLSGNKDAFFYLYDKLKNEYLSDLGIGSQSEDYFLPNVRRPYLQCQRILTMPVEEYLFDRLQSAAPKSNISVCGSADELKEIKESSSYRIGRAITFVPRMAVKFIRYVRSCGLKSAITMVCSMAVLRLRKNKNNIK